MILNVKFLIEFGLEAQKDKKFISFPFFLLRNRIHRLELAFLEGSHMSNDHCRLSC